MRSFGQRVAAKLGRGGNPEDQLRGPAEVLIQTVGELLGLDVTAYGEVQLKDIRARPDYAVDVGTARVGYIELKAPGRGVPPTWSPDSRERAQWAKLATLPNVLYTDGIQWNRFTFGEPDFTTPITFRGSIGSLRDELQVDGQDFELLVERFLGWEPIRPRTLGELIDAVAGLCQLLRDEVSALLSATWPHRGAREDLKLLADDWRNLLFPDLDDDNFADAYSQTVAFAMLLAQVVGVSLDKTPLHEIGRQLGKKHTLIGRAFAVLVDTEATEELRVIETLRRVIGAVDWNDLDDGETNAYAELYERFLEAYDPELRKESGSYYTPEPVARFMVDFVDEVLIDRLGQRRGLAEKNVLVLDPAMGTGTFLVEIMRATAQTIKACEGPGAVPAQLRHLFSKRLIGFERQVAPYSIAELRLHQALKSRFDTEIPRLDVRFLTDALEDPTLQRIHRASAAQKILEHAHTDANRIKRDERVMVIIGNPPHVENAQGMAPWVERRRTVPPERAGIPLTSPSMDEFREPGQGRYESDLHALQWYFWRWATWKVFDAHPDSPSGIVAFITPASYLTSRAFRGMRAYLRRTCDDGWIIDVSPEGNRPDPRTRLFEGVQRQLCIGIFSRAGRSDPETPAKIRHTTLYGSRAEKLASMELLHPDSDEWQLCEDEWHSPFLPPSDEEWASFVPLSEVMPWSSRGVTTGRGWVYSPDPETLRERWRRLLAADVPLRRELFRESRDRKLESKVRPLPGQPSHTATLAEETTDSINVVKVGFRSFDRQYIIADSRLMSVARPPLWLVDSSRQVFVAEQSSHPIESGPALTFSELIPDLHYFNNRSGKIYPLFRDSLGSAPNLAPGLLDYLRDRLDLPDRLSVEDALSYVAGIVSHSGYTSRFWPALRKPGVRVPFTAVSDLWTQAVDLGRRVLWLQTYGERGSSGTELEVVFEDLMDSRGPRVAVAIPEGFDDMPDRLTYCADKHELHIGDFGVIAPVSPEVWRYDVGGMNILRRWFDYRSKQPRHKRRSTDLDDTRCRTWKDTLTTDLLRLLTSLQGCVDIAPAQAELLELICADELITSRELLGAAVLPAPRRFAKPPKLDEQEGLF